MSTLTDSIRAFLAAHSTFALATVNAEGQPQNVPLFYAVSDDTLIWISGQHSRHSRNAAASGIAAVTIYDERWTWHEIAGVQMEGEVSLIAPGPAREQAWDVYLAKFPFAIEFEAEISHSEFFRFVPRWARLIDNRVQFGYREEIDLSQAQEYNPPGAGPQDG
jgi:uncharacterized protein YhbP (UPF0306 family)